MESFENEGIHEPPDAMAMPRGFALAYAMKSIAFITCLLERIQVIITSIAITNPVIIV